MKHKIFCPFIAKKQVNILKHFFFSYVWSIYKSIYLTSDKKKYNSFEKMFIFKSTFIDSVEKLWTARDQ